MMGPGAGGDRGRHGHYHPSRTEIELPPKPQPHPHHYPHPRPAPYGMGHALITLYAYATRTTVEPTMSTPPDRLLTQLVGARHVTICKLTHCHRLVFSCLRSLQNTSGKRGRVTPAAHTASRCTLL